MFSVVLRRWPLLLLRYHALAEQYHALCVTIDFLLLYLNTEGLRWLCASSANGIMYLRVCLNPALRKMLSGLPLKPACRHLCENLHHTCDRASSSNTPSLRLE